MSKAQLSRREREIMDILFRIQSGSVREVLDEMEQAPGYSGARALLGLLCDKGHVKRRKEGRKYVYLPATPAGRARRHACQHWVRTFFGGSTEDAFAYLIDDQAAQLSEEELDRLAERIEAARLRRRS